jgi:signal peptidase II
VSASSSRPPASSASGSLVAAVVASVVLALDQLTKAWAVSALDNGRTIDVVWTLRLKLTFNDGAAFSFGGGSGGVLALAGLLVVAVVYRSVLRWPGRLPPLALGLVLGGAIGNLVDRVARDGRVVDFIDLQWWPLFNVADIGISCGAVLLILLSLRNEDRDTKAVAS